MNKIIIVGHPSSDYQEVHSLLRQSGMQDAQPARREGHTPAEIAAILCKAHAVVPLAVESDQQYLTQIHASPLWNVLALDLMLGNMDASFWGWADPAAVHLLEFWSQLEPSIKFVLVYADPESALLYPPTESELSEPGIIEARINSWVAFNQTILHFYHRHTDRCVLVHAEQVKRSVDAYLQQLRVRLQAPVSTPEADMGESGQPAQPNDLPELVKTAITPVTAGPVPLSQSQSALSHLVASRALEQFPLVRQLFQDLQTAANLPFDGTTVFQPTSFDAWASLWRDLGTMAASKARAESLEREISESKAAVFDRQQLKDLEEENELLLNQLHQVQEELERYYLELQATKAKSAPATTTPVAASSRPIKPAGASKRFQVNAPRFFSKLRSYARCLVEAKAISRNGEFDSAWYLNTYPDVAAELKFAKNPALHYIEYGAQEGRDPSSGFSTNTYLWRYPDVRQSGINPFLHYIKHGKREGRHPC